MEQKRENWGSLVGFIMATIGAAIGLGNVWKFPYVTGMNGGGAFVLLYVLCVLVFGLPVMICEMVIGRKTNRNGFGAFRQLQQKPSNLCNLIAAGFFLCGAAFVCSGKYGFGTLMATLGVLLLKLQFSFFGLLSIIGGLCILSYYAVIGGWILDYTLQAFFGAFDYPDMEAAEKGFNTMINSPWRCLGSFFFFLFFCAVMPFGGIRKGIEKWSKVFLPVLFFLLLVVIARSLTLPGAREGVEFFLKPDFSKLSSDSVLESLGLCFFSLSLGMGITINYGSYLKENVNIFSASLLIAFMDTLAAIMAGLAIFPAVFAMGLDPAAGPGLIFKTLPVVFNKFPGGFGWVWAGLFLLMLLIAALTSAVALLQMGVTMCMDELKWSCRKSVCVTTAFVMLLGIFPALSSSDWSRIEWLHRTLGWLFGKDCIPGSCFDLVDYVTSNWMLSSTAIAICLLVGWVWGTKKASGELRFGAEKSCMDTNLVALMAGFTENTGGDSPKKDGQGLTLMALWAIVVRFLAPALILVIFLQAVLESFGS